MNAFLYPPNASKASTKKKPVAETAIKDLEAKRVNHPRTAMGEYTGTPPLSSLGMSFISVLYWINQPHNLITMLL